ncbi:NADH-quinone oxidoreductase subunit N [Thiohalorhabdus sp. Cl-TMA]|uniref:NADH-quinone oxidoreductase subunit N n=1 Tax=Thiohalorhabdus methylotrophus TaxID=3242694 RepID=A0ABV4TWF9_9GAMM
MNAADLPLLLPWLILGGGALAVMGLIAFARRHELVAGATLATLALALVLLPAATGAGTAMVTPLLRVDGFALFFTGLILASALVTGVLAYLELRRRPVQQPEELYLLLLLSTLGGTALTASAHFASFFLALELLSVPLFALIAYPVPRARAVEAGFKYLVLSGASSAVLLFGMALIYAESGALGFADLALQVPRESGGIGLYWVAGMAMILAGVGFKLSLVPFHLWTPDIYQGAPPPVAGFVATVSKGAVFAVLLRYGVDTGVFQAPGPAAVAVLLAVASMLAGNLLALLQENVRRLLAYSSIAHLGYLLVALLAGGSLGVEAAAYYLAAYFVTMLGAFGTVSAAGLDGREVQDQTDLRGLFWRRPGLAVSFTLMLLSLAGIPLTMGFVGKFYLFVAGVGDMLWTLLGALVVGSAIGLFYYLRLVGLLFQPPEETAPPPRSDRAGGAVVALLAVLLVLLGLYPTPLIDLIGVSAAG